MAKEVTQETIGQKLSGVHERDAIHIAVMPVVCGFHPLVPGQRVCLIDGGRVEPAFDRSPVGIVDPFLTEHVLHEGDTFWMFLLPNTITGLRHQWTHPGIDAEPSNQAASERWIRGFCSEWNFDYDELIHQASAAQGDPGDWENHRYIVARNVDLHSAEELGEDHDRFWRHLEIVTGRRFDEAHRSNFGWSCAC